MTTESPAIGLPDPYGRDPAGWAPKSRRSPRSIAPGRRLAEGQAADAALRGTAWITLPVGELRRLLLLAAAAFDAAELQSTHTPASSYRKGLKTRAYLVACCLWDHDQDHGSSRGPIPATDPHWTEGKHHGNLLDYVRQELAVLLDAEAVEQSQSSSTSIT